MREEVKEFMMAVIAGAGLVLVVMVMVVVVEDYKYKKWKKEHKALTKIKTVFLKWLLFKKLW